MNSSRPEDKMSSFEKATVDLDRARRCGFGEVIYGEGKSSELITEIAAEQLAADQNVLVTRLAEEAAAEIIRALPFPAFHDASARTLELSRESIPQWRPSDLATPHIAVVTAGSTDAPVAAEAAATLRWMRLPFRTYTDIGVAGPWRLDGRLEELRAARVIVVAAGMEGALPSVVAGHVSVPVIAVPTSVGYGSNLQGITPLLTAMASCAAGVMTVGIDAGFKGGYCAGLILKSG